MAPPLSCIPGLLYPVSRTEIRLFGGHMLLPFSFSEFTPEVPRVVGGLVTSPESLEPRRKSSRNA